MSFLHDRGGSRGETVRGLPTLPTHPLEMEGTVVWGVPATWPFPVSCAPVPTTRVPLVGERVCHRQGAPTTGVEDLDVDLKGPLGKKVAQALSLLG